MTAFPASMRLQLSEGKLHLPEDRLAPHLSDSVPLSDEVSDMASLSWESHSWHPHVGCGTETLATEQQVHVPQPGKAVAEPAPL